MKIIIITFVLVPFLYTGLHAQSPLSLKIKNNEIFPDKILTGDSIGHPLKKKHGGSYFGIGYSFVMFTDNIMNVSYPVVDTKSGTFVYELNLYFGLALTKALTIEIEPSFSYARNNRFEKMNLNTSVTYNGTAYNYDFPSEKRFTAFPIAVNLKLFPFNKSNGFSRMIFIGAGAGAILLNESYDHIFTQNQNYTGIFDTSQVVLNTSSTSQWEPLFSAEAGLTEGRGPIYFGCELRYSFIPLKSSGEPFMSRMAKNANSFDIALRLYYFL